MNLIERTISVLCQVLLWISTVVIFAILVGNTILRYATGASLQWANEVPELLFPWLVMSGVVLAAQHGAHELHRGSRYLIEPVRIPDLLVLDVLCVRVRLPIDAIPQNRWRLTEKLKPIRPLLLCQPVPPVIRMDLLESIIYSKL